MPDSAPTCIQCYCETEKRASETVARWKARKFCSRRCALHHDKGYPPGVPLTDEQAADICTLRKFGASLESAVDTVTKPKERVRAPSMAELETWAKDAYATRAAVAALRDEIDF